VFDATSKHALRALGHDSEQGRPAGPRPKKTSAWSIFRPWTGTIAQDRRRVGADLDGTMLRGSDSSACRYSVNQATASTASTDTAEPRYNQALLGRGNNKFFC
jgi:hypothetical protein